MLEQINHDYFNSVLPFKVKLICSDRPCHATALAEEHTHYTAHGDSGAPGVIHHGLGEMCECVDVVAFISNFQSLNKRFLCVPWRNVIQKRLSEMSPIRREVPN
ncbi:hypothetical protein MHYP_G00321460 [Metynnis hypsauchen]